MKASRFSISISSSVSRQSTAKPGHTRVTSRTPRAGIPVSTVREVTLVCPGFAVDCLETLEEIDIENRDAFMRAGGQRFQYVPALNARASHAQCLAHLTEQHRQGWTHAGPGRLPSAARGASA